MTYMAPDVDNGRIPFDIVDVNMAYRAIVQRRRI
jgi:hypothetical protein